MTYAQFGEDDIVLGLVGPEPRVFLDIGAGDGMEISNSRLFREMGWPTLLVEADKKHAPALRSLDPPASVHIATVTPVTINRYALYATVLSIDVDGDDIFLLEALQHQPEVIIIEHNPTIPYHFDVQPARFGRRVGASVSALARVANGKGYGLAAVTHCNAIFRFGAESIEIPPYEPAYAVATEYFTGRPFVVGEAPWGVDFANPSQEAVVR